jgi:cell division protein FtsB
VAHLTVDPDKVFTRLKEHIANLALDRASLQAAMETLSAENSYLRAELQSLKEKETGG